MGTNYIRNGISQDSLQPKLVVIFVASFITNDKAPLKILFWKHSASYAVLIGQI